MIIKWENLEETRYLENSHDINFGIISIQGEFKGKLIKLEGGRYKSYISVYTYNRSGWTQLRDYDCNPLIKETYVSEIRKVKKQIVEWFETIGIICEN